MSREIKVLHLESTDVCQAACPLCARETNPDFNKNIKNHLRIDQLLEHFNDNAIAELDKVFMCGNYGDPVAGKNTLDILKYVRNINPSITLGINTNGALQTTAWWSEVGKLFNNPTDYVVFSIDGLADTNSIYRVNVIWEKVMNNAKTFIDAGGSAHWDMLVYKHNQHQVESAEQLSRNMGFSWFRAKVSKRTPIAGLEQPDEWADPLPNTGPIQCHVLAEKSAYIDAQGRLYPCCWLGNSLDVLISDISEVEKTWYTDNPNPTCKGACSTSNSISRFKDQWRKETQLK
jgi:MoaA/NifB/PqqE/SkfB family radical SAM enzyme|tara:strand:- start:28 stop:894 length:867 start_codon:yes stop_codon:yes gene_type:complete